MCVDLHTHSLHSDGTASPAQLIGMAAAAGLTGFALTDHDTVAGVREAMQLGQERGLKVISGVELNAQHDAFDLHILGYGIDADSPHLHNSLAKLQQGRTERNLRILDKLAKLGMDISIRELEQLSAGGQTGRPHIARLLLDKGYVKSATEAFERYLGRNKPAWCSRFAYSAEETIAIIHQAGGAAVLAHPGTLDSAMKVQPHIVRELVGWRLDGLEVHYPGHTQPMIEQFALLARQHRLVATGGSDYHGDGRIKGLAGTAIGCCPPDSIMQELHARLAGLKL